MSKQEISKMKNELNWLSEKVEALDTKIAYILDDGYTKYEIKDLVKEQEMLSNILNAMTLKEIS